MTDLESLKSALQGAHTVFALTNTWEGLSKDRETELGKTVAGAAVGAGAKYPIWSSPPNAAKISNGKLMAHEGEPSPPIIIESTILPPLPCSSLQGTSNTQTLTPTTLRHHPGLTPTPSTAHPAVTQVARAQGGDAHPLDRDRKRFWDRPRILLSPPPPNK